MARLAVEVAGLALRNPVLSASGTFGHGLEMQHLVDVRTLGGLVSKTVTLRPRPGNPLPRIRETEAGFLNSIGLENRGIDAYVRDVLPDMQAADTAVVTNIGAERVDEFAELAARLSTHPAVDALEVNLSCPNVQEGKLPFATDPEMAARVIERVRAVTKKPLFAKLSPNVSRIGEMARAVKIPVIGCGGIKTADDVLEFLVVGCAAVQVGTASFGDPGLIGRLAGEIAAKLDAAGIATAAELVGTLRLPQPPAAAAATATPSSGGASSAHPSGSRAPSPARSTDEAAIAAGGAPS